MKLNDDFMLTTKHKELREMIRNKIANPMDKKISVGAMKRTGGSINRDSKLKTIARVFGYSPSALKHWRAGKQGIGRQRLYVLLYSLDFEFLEQLEKDMIGDKNA